MNFHADTRKRVSIQNSRMAVFYCVREFLCEFWVNTSDEPLQSSKNGYTLCFAAVFFLNAIRRQSGRQCDHFFSIAIRNDRNVFLIVLDSRCVFLIVLQLHPTPRGETFCECRFKTIREKAGSKMSAHLQWEHFVWTINKNNQTWRELSVANPEWWRSV